jgi:hypothetical protein
MRLASFGSVIAILDWFPLECFALMKEKGMHMEDSQSRVLVVTILSILCFSCFSFVAHFMRLITRDYLATVSCLLLVFPSRICPFASSQLKLDSSLIF